MHSQGCAHGPGNAASLYSGAGASGDPESYRRRGLVVSREQGKRCRAGFAVPVQMCVELGVGHGCFSVLQQ